MSNYIVSSLIAFVLFGMGLTALILGAMNALDNRKSKSVEEMFMVCLCVFVWDFGYAWMSLCYESDFSYVPRALALLAVTFYMYFIIRYVAEVTEYPRKWLTLFFSLDLSVSLVAWIFIIQKNAVEFVMTPWGYWYYSGMSWARIAQFASVIACLVQYYVILVYGLKRAGFRREKYILHQFIWFGPIMILGYMFDTLVPIVFKTAAIPGSSVGAFISSMVLFNISRTNKVFGLSMANVSEYVFRDVQIPVIITNLEGEIVLCNEYTQQYLNTRTEQIKNQSIDKFFTATTDDVVKVIGTKRECKLEKTEVKDQFGAVLYSIYFVSDVTKERQNMRMLELSREQAEEANRAKSNFLANMSHEIRTPMNAIIGMSEIILQEKEIPDKNLMQVNDIRIAGQNLLTIINDVLDISKIESGRYELVPDTYGLPALINEVCNLIGIRLQESPVVLRIHLDETLPKMLIGDVGRVRQILLNILGNAVKFTKEGSITFSVAWNHDVSDPKIFFDIADTGIGIKKEDVTKIFGAFNQVDTRKNRNIQGTGLGLAISKHLSELMDGNITIDSVYGKGSTFHITISQLMDEYIPMGERLAVTLENREYKQIINKTVADSIKYPNAKILVVDDTKMNLKIAVGLMQKYEMQIDTATSGLEAIEMVQKQDYNIIFMDHMMPEMDGIEAMHKIRELDEKYEKLTIIALTANAVNDAKEMFLQEGMQDFLAKPIEPKLLDDMLRKWLV